MAGDSDGSGKKPNRHQSPRYRNLADNVAGHLARGGTVTGTAAMFGIDRRTLHRWLETPHFVALVERKKELWRQELLGSIQESSQWTAKAWLLERSPAFRGQYDPPQSRRDSHTGPLVVQIAIAGPREHTKNAPDQVDVQPQTLPAGDHEQ